MEATQAIQKKKRFYDDLKIEIASREEPPIQKHPIIVIKQLNNMIKSPGEPGSYTMILFIILILEIFSKILKQLLLCLI